MVRGTAWGLPPVGMARRSLLRAMDALVKRGLIIRRPLGLSSEWTISLEAFAQQTEEEAVALPVPKRKRTAAEMPRSTLFDFGEDGEGSANLAPTQCQIGTENAPGQCQIGTLKKIEAKE
jgi:hypothetical protein